MSFRLPSLVILALIEAEIAGRGRICPPFPGRMILRPFPVRVLTRSLPKQKSRLHAQCTLHISSSSTWISQSIVTVGLSVPPTETAGSDKVLHFFAQLTTLPPNRPAYHHILLYRKPRRMTYHHYIYCCASFLLRNIYLTYDNIYHRLLTVAN